MRQSVVMPTYVSIGVAWCRQGDVVKQRQTHNQQHVMRTHDAEHVKLICDVSVSLSKLKNKRANKTSCQLLVCYTIIAYVTFPEASSQFFSYLTNCSNLFSLRICTDIMFALSGGL